MDFFLLYVIDNIMSNTVRVLCVVYSPYFPRLSICQPVSGLSPCTPGWDGRRQPHMQARHKEIYSKICECKTVTHTSLTCKYTARYLDERRSQMQARLGNILVSSEDT